MRQTIKYARVRAKDKDRLGLRPVTFGVYLNFTRGVYLRGTKVRIHSV